MTSVLLLLWQFLILGFTLPQASKPLKQLMNSARAKELFFIQEQVEDTKPPSSGSSIHQ
jgi:hypothetical protein